jgi:hypothetical protein
MRPASEIHSALDLLENEVNRCLDREIELSGKHIDPDISARLTMSLARDVLRWVVGRRVDLDGPNVWLAGFLLDDPDKLDSTRPEVN